MHKYNRKWLFTWRKSSQNNSTSLANFLKPHLSLFYWYLPNWIFWAILCKYYLLGSFPDLSCSQTCLSNLTHKKNLTHPKLLYILFILRQFTLEKPDIARLVLKSSINFAWDSSPVPGCQCWISILEFTITDPPHITRLKEKQLASDHGYSIKVSLASIRLGR